MYISGIEETKSKYSPPSLQRLCRSGQPSIFRDLRAGSCWRRPCGNLFIPGHEWIINRSREVRPSMPSGSTFSSEHQNNLRCLSFARSPRFEGSATKLSQFQTSNPPSEAGNFGISSKLRQYFISNLSNWGSGRNSSEDDPLPSSLLHESIPRD